MVTIAVRALQSAVAVLAGLCAAWLLGGDGPLAKLVAVPMVAIAAIAIEYLLTIAPKRVPWIRRRLDPRAIFEGVWLQNVKKVATDSAEPRSNRFAVFTVTYSGGKYELMGTAYTPAGKEHSRWWSTGPLHFSADGRSVTYQWEGTVMTEKSEIANLDRTGFCRLQLSSNDSGTGRVDHVAMQVTLIFDLQRVTQEIVQTWRTGIASDILRNEAQRDAFAAAYAKSLVDSD